MQGLWSQSPIQRIPFCVAELVKTPAADGTAESQQHAPSKTNYK